jgi:serine/threonine-protein kinase
VVSRCLEREPANRYADLAELARAIAPFGSGAYEGYSLRIEQTLRRASAMFDADATTMTRLKKLDAAGLEAAMFLGPARSSVRAVGAGPSQPVTEDASRQVDTLPAPALRRTWVRWAAAGAALLVAGISFVALRGTPHGSAPAPADSATAMHAAPSPAPEAPPSAQATQAPLPAPVSPVVSRAPSAPAPAASQSRPSSTRKAKPKATTQGLPGVLQSSD